MNIYPVEIEAMLIRMPGVADCAVFGILGSRVWRGPCGPGWSPTRVPSWSPDAVRDFLGARLAGFKVPRVVEFSSALPREETGKIFKRLLREPYWLGRERRI